MLKTHNYLLIVIVLLFSFSCSNDEPKKDLSDGIKIDSNNKHFVNFTKTQDYALFLKSGLKLDLNEITLMEIKVNDRIITALNIKVITPDKTNNKINNVPPDNDGNTYTYYRNRLDLMTYENVDGNGLQWTQLKKVEGTEITRKSDRKLLFFDGVIEHITPDNQYKIGGSIFFGSNRVGFVANNVPSNYIYGGVIGAKYSSFNACYQALKKACDEDWMCDVVCSITPCWASRIATCIVIQYL